VNKKLSELTEKVTSLNADDLLYVSTNGESKSIKASTLEAPLKAYTDLKKSEVISEIEAVDAKLDTEIANRASGDTSTLSSAQAYTDSKISIEQSARQAAISSEASLRSAGDSSTLQSAQSYTDSKISAEQSARQASDTSVYNSVMSYLNDEIYDVKGMIQNVPVGTIHTYAGTTSPIGYIFCDGSAVSRGIYSALFAVIGTTYGAGNGSTTFNLPNPDTNSNLRLIIKI